MKRSNRFQMIITIVSMLGVAACSGGNQEEPETPSAPPPEPAAAEPAPAADDATGGSAPAGEHTMPDGTKMEGDDNSHDANAPAH